MIQRERDDSRGKTSVNKEEETREILSSVKISLPSFFQIKIRFFSIGFERFL